MATKLGTNNISDIYLGNLRVSKIYNGSGAAVYEYAEPTPPTGKDAIALFVEDGQPSGDYENELITTVAYLSLAQVNAVTSISLPNVTTIKSFGITSSGDLTTLYIGTNLNTVCTLEVPNNNNPLPIDNLTTIYVPSALVESYKSANGWSNYADKIVGI